MDADKLTYELKASPSGVVVVRKTGMGARPNRYLTAGQRVCRKSATGANLMVIAIWLIDEHRGRLTREETMLSRLVFDRHATAEEAALLEEIAA